jgi:hypothetical protein
MDIGDLIYVIIGLIWFIISIISASKKTKKQQAKKTLALLRNLLMMSLKEPWRRYLVVLKQEKKNRPASPRSP